MIDDMAVYIANLGKYNEGYLVGAFYSCNNNICWNKYHDCYDKSK